MSFVPELLGFGVFADVSQAEQDLLRLGDSGGGAAAALEEKLGGASDGLKALGKESSKTSRGIQGLAAVVSLVDPRIGQVVRSVGTLTRGLSVLRLGLGPAAAAVTAVTGALALYQHEQRKSEEAAAAAEQRTRDLTTALEDQHAIYLDLQTQIDLINGDTDRFAVQFEKRRAQIESTGQAVTDALDAEIAAVEEKIRVQEQERRVSLEQQATVRGLREELAELNQERQDAVDATDSQVAAAEAYSEYLREQRESEEFLRKRAEARRASAQQQRELDQAAAELARQERDSRLAVLSQEEALLFVYREQVAEIERLGALTGDQAAMKRALAAEEKQLQYDLNELRREQHKEQMDRLDEERDRRIAAAQEEQALLEQDQQAALSIYSSLADAAVTAAQKRAEGDEAAAARAKATAKTLGLAEVAIARAVGIQNAIARNAGRPVATGLAVAAQIAAAIQQTAAIAAAHQGARLAPDEVPDARGFTRLRGERDNGPNQILSPEASRRLERGEAMAPSIVAVPAFQHFGLFFPDYIQGAGTPLADELNRTRDTGRSVY